jgi:hypothetical protein
MNDLKAERDDLPFGPKNTGPSIELKARVLAAVATRYSPPRQAAARKTLGLVVVACLPALAIFAYAGGIRLAGRPLPLLLGTATATAIVAAVATWAALARGRSNLPRARAVVIAITIAGPLTIFLWKMIWSSQFSGGLDECTARPGLRCLALGLVVGVFPLGAFLLSRRGTDPVRPGLTGFAAGVAIGCASASLTDLWCPVAYAPHLLLGHILPILTLGVLGRLFGAVALGLRRSG